MKLIKDIGLKHVYGRNARHGLFECICGKRLEKIMHDGHTAKYCGRHCPKNPYRLKGTHEKKYNPMQYFP